MSNREGIISRSTNETQIKLSLNLDGSGKSELSTGIAFFDHMLDLFSTHGLFDLTIEAKGDLDVDYHHTVEDIGICLGQAFKKAIGDAKGIARYASGLIPMDESLCQIAVDIANRPHLSFTSTPLKSKVGDFDSELLKEFLTAFTNQSGICLHINCLQGENTHHIIESCFKALGVILDKATIIDNRKKSIPSTKGTL